MERTALQRSIAVSAVLSLLGVAWGIASGSQVILLDGVYGVVGLGTSWLLLRAAALAGAGPSRAYPFGREALTPLAIGITGVVQLGTLVYATAEAALVIAGGGSVVDAGPAIVYSAIVTAVCLVVWRRLAAAAAGSELLASEAIGWRLAAVRGVAMLAGFTLLAVVTGTGLAGLAPFIDPAMVLVTTALLVSAPLGMVRRTLGELLEAGPPEDIAAQVRSSVDAIAGRFELDEPTVRLAKVGRKVYVEVVGVAEPTVTIAQEDALRRALEADLERHPFDAWVTLELVPRGAPGGRA